MERRLQITSLPPEILEQILKWADVTSKDIVNFATTCKHFYGIIKGGNNLWKKRFFERWPRLKIPYQDYELAGSRINNWQEEARMALETRDKLMYEISLLSNKHHAEEEISYKDLRQFDPLFRPEDGAFPMAYEFVTHHLIEVIGADNIIRNLTLTYYSMKVLRYIRQRHLSQKWQEFISLPSKEQIMERGAFIISQWSQPLKIIREQSIYTTLDHIAEQVKLLIAEDNPVHPIFSASKEELEAYKRYNLEDNMWDPLENREVLDATRKHLFFNMNFEGNSDFHYVEETMFIDRVLESKYGTAMVLSVIFEAVGRRLGLKCEPLNFPAHFLLRWRSKYDDPLGLNCYVDVYSKGRVVTRNDCPRVSGSRRCPIERFNVHSAASPAEVIGKMASNLETAVRQYIGQNGRPARLRAVLELRHLVQPDDTDVMLHLSRYYMASHMDVSDFIKTLQYMRENVDVTSRGQVENILYKLQVYQKRYKPVPVSQVKRRTPDVKYAIGLFVMHPCTLTGVIAGWDLCCNAPDNWTDAMNTEVDVEPDDDETHPFYTVLLRDGSTHYVSQAKLELPMEGWKITALGHSQIGRFFDKFTGICYIPNEAKAREYPEDAEVRERLSEGLRI